MPDICGKAEYPNKKVGERYVSWYDEHIGKYLRELTNDEDSDEDKEYPCLSGKTLYQLRCAFLHEGVAEGEKTEVDSFTLVLRESDDLLSGGEQIYVHTKDDGTVYRDYQVDVKYICKFVLQGAKNYYDKNKELFRIYSDINILDLTSCTSEERTRRILERSAQIADGRQE